jgi:hypothetical protein
MDNSSRRKLQNRIAQRNYRWKLKTRLLELEERSQTDHDTIKATPADSTEHIDPEVMVYQDANEIVKMSCICKSSSDQRFIISCLECGNWQHIACYYESAKDYMDEHRCVQCSPRIVEPKVPSSKRPANVAFSIHSSSTEYRSKRQAPTWGGESSIGRHVRDGSETAFTEPSTYSDFRSKKAEDSRFSYTDTHDAFSLTAPVSPLPENYTNLTDRNEYGADCTSGMEVCHCASSSEKSTDPTSRHILDGLAGKLPDAWEEIQDLLPESYKWDIEYVTTHSNSGADVGCWTCVPLDGGDSVPLTIPLTVADAPVVLPVEHQWPPVGGIQPPPDPRPSSLIDCWTELPIDTIRDVFITFEGSLGFYVLISGLLQIIVEETFNTTWASSHLPHRYGGLKVCYIVNTMEPTMLQSNVATSSDTASSLQTQPSRGLSTSKQARSTQSLQLNDFIEAKVSSTSRERFAGRIGLRVEKDGLPYLVMSSHIITEAILSKSFFGLSRDPVKRLREDWNKNAEIWAGNAKVRAMYHNHGKASQHGS